MKALWYFVIFFSMSGVAIAQENRCSSDNFQGCSSCQALEAAVDYKDPNKGDYYRGALWNGLFAAYRLNCPLVGYRLIDSGATVVNGGLYGSMILTVSSKWPHEDKKINESWAAMLLLKGAKLGSYYNAPKYMNSKDAVAEYSFEPDYFDIYALFDKGFWE